MKREMNNKREYLNYVYNMIIDKNFDVARIKIDELKNNEYYNNYSFEIDYLNDFLEEQIIFNGEKHDKIQEYLSSGRDSLYYSSLDEAFDYFSAGDYVTEFPLFYYMMGKTLIMTQDRQDEGIDYLEEYINRHGGSKAYKAYKILEEYYFFLDEEKAKEYAKKRDKLALITNINFKRKDRSAAKEDIQEVELLGKNFELDKLYELFDKSNDEIKLRIIGELYKRGFRKQADSLYKKNRRIIEKHSKNSRRLVHQLDNNKTLFINKGKHNING